MAAAIRRAEEYWLPEARESVDAVVLAGGIGILDMHAIGANIIGEEPGPLPSPSAASEVAPIRRTQLDLVKRVVPLWPPRGLGLPVAEARSPFHFTPMANCGCSIFHFATHLAARNGTLCERGATR